MGHIFISYSHKDKGYVHKLQKALQEEGFEVWADDRIDYGTEWPTIIQSHLDNCDAFIVVLSETAFKSKWVQNEVTRASRKGKPFFPLLLQGDPWLSVEATQYVDVTKGTLPPENFYARLESVVPRKKKIEGALPEPTPAQQHPKPIQQPRKSSRWHNVIIIPASFIGILAVLLATIFALLSPVPPFSSYENSYELSDMMLSTVPGAGPDRTDFSRGEKIYLSLFLHESQETGGYEARWFYTISLFESNKSILIARQDNKDPGISDSVIFEHNSHYLSGTYRVDVYKDGNLIAIRYFSVK